MSRKSVKSLHPTERAPEELDDVKAENQDTKAEIAEDGEEKRRENRHVEDLAVEEKSRLAQFFGGKTCATSFFFWP